MYFHFHIIFKKMNKIKVPLLFSLDLDGQLFEPESEMIYDKVVQAFVKEFSLNNRGFWIGAKYDFGLDFGNGDFEYISSKRPMIKKVPLGNTADHCVWASSQTRMKNWRATPCSFKYPGTVCEITK